MGMEVSDNPQHSDSTPPPTYTSHGNNNNNNNNSRRTLLSINGTDPTSSNVPTMSQYSFQTVADVPEMDDAVSEDMPVPQYAPAVRGSSSGRGRGRGRWPRARTAKITKPAQAKLPSGRGRRHKVYDSLKVQAAHERIQELRQAYSSVVRVVKPAVQEIADRSINELLEDPTAHKQVPEYDATKNFLRSRHQDTFRQCNDRLQHGLAMIENVWQAQRQKVNEEYTTKVAELCEDRYGQLLRQLDTLEYLYDNRLPVDLPALPDERYLFKEVSQEDADWQGVFYQVEDGVEVPHSGKTISELMVKPQTLPLEAKRKAEGQPGDQPAPKAAAAAKGDDPVAQMPRHPAGLLGATEAIEESATTTPDSASNAPSPAAPPEPVEEVGQERAGQPVTGGAETPDDGPELPIPRSATSPDEFGVRLISRRPTRMDVPNNRVMAPNLFEWDDLDIGFRDSTNCAKKGATKQRRGKYLGKPGSNYMFIDRRVGIWDSTLAAGELDEELLKKHKLHPTLGIVLPGSVNEWEPPKPTVSGWKPVVFVPPSGEPIHASRTIERARMDRETDEVEARAKVAQLVRTICDQEDISGEDVAPDPELVESARTEILVARGVDPAQVAVPQPEPSPPPSEPVAEEPVEQHLEEPVVEDTTAFVQFADDALRAAAAIEAEEGTARMAAAKRTTQPSRPYDAIRDVFTETPTARQPSPPPANETPSPAFADTTGLSRLADLALQSETAAPQHTVVEPVYYTQPPPPPPQVSDRPNDYEQPQVEYTRPFEYSPPPEPTRLSWQDVPTPSVEPVRSNDFLRTALNPQPATPTPPMLPVQDYSGVHLGPAPGNSAPQVATGRNPYSSSAGAKALPALRPMRSLLNEAPAYPEPQGSPALHHSNMVPSNSGAFYPPAANRPFHNAYSFQDPAQPMQFTMPQQPLHNNLQAPPLGGPPMGSAPLRRMSTPPPYHQPIGPAPGLAMHYQGPPQPPAAGGPVPRSRPGSSSAAAAAANAAAAAAASKYRKLEPAPTPPHRLSYSGNGQELRTVPFDPRGSIKDYPAVEAPPKHGPTHIRGWTHNNIRKASAAHTRPSPSSPKGDGTHSSAGVSAGAGAGVGSDEPSV
ncbi:hypothetical protein N658DRAFT_14144 [Parathielavia hyrcaniae]|uniref:Uncharacterized protein n=1 Tax=Parathielavia hyrcaniae TaxID=113614 RepID=A0AAN6T5U4_9PEZI|nr:hypothetical protein N658DRAFT_14144 [Parathielavia hyrcaniae]